jgi:hypothetical protein
LRAEFFRGFGWALVCVAEGCGIAPVSAFVAGGGVV